ncbi:MAG: hypothetical protein LBU76_07140 [Azoarcus sp.]|jgi:hypothetical protein|nr:hypothetical protein [Azoarcus sp.]
MANDFDKEYYVMSVGGSNNHPLLDWGKTDNTDFPDIEPMNELKLPLKIIFGQPYLKQYEMSDFLMLGADYARSEKFKKLFERNKIYGVQFIPVEIESNKKEIITGHYYIHFWNRLRAIDEKNYEGGQPNGFGLIHDLERFSLNGDLLNGISLEKRLIFPLLEKPSLVIVHKSLCEIMEKEKINGVKYFRVDEWDEDSIFK